MSDFVNDPIEEILKPETTPAEKTTAEKTTSEKSGSGVSRRQFLGMSALGAAALSFGVGGYAVGVEPFWHTVRTHTIKTAKWPKGKPPITIAFATDFHVGCPSVPLESVPRIVESINAVGADVILLGGDYLISDVVMGSQVPADKIGAALTGLKAKMGVYSVLGNHDWFRYGKEMWKALENAGIKVLENKAVAVKAGDQSFWVAGMADDSTRKPDYKKTIRSVKNNDPVVMLAHDPGSFLDIGDRPCLTLCGHTHGGQLVVPLVGPLMIPGRAPLKYAYGYINEGGREMIVSGGLGTSKFPVRFGRRPEILKITIQSSDDGKDIQTVG